MNWDYGPLIEAVRMRTEGAVGAALPCGGLALTPGNAQLRLDMAGNAHLTLRISMAAKTAEQREGVALLAKAQRAASGMKCSAGGWMIIGCSAIGAPVYEGQDAQGWYLFSAALEVKGFSREVSE